ncbi:MAG: methyl-accepting chemotaxis protein [Chloroflexia bacterium]|nr:methyl-accepting chemotaxis protein [Chloroflexia bacterium]
MILLKKGDGYFLLPPYQDVYENDTLWMISYIHEIKNGNEIIGLGGVDIGIDWMQSFISKSDIFNEKASIMIISDRGIINAYSKNKGKVGKTINEELSTLDVERNLLFSDQSNYLTINGSYVFYKPIEINKLKEGWHIRIEVPESEIIGAAQKALIIRIVIAIVIAIISLLITFIYFNKIVARIRKLAAAAKRMAKGNLFIDFQTVGNDEITDLGKSLQSIITRFSEIITGVKTTMEQFRESGNALSSTAIKLSEGASEQASSTEEVSASMEQMSANIEQNAENAKLADKIAQKSSNEIEESSKKVKENCRINE